MQGVCSGDRAGMPAFGPEGRAEILSTTDKAAVQARPDLSYVEIAPGSDGRRRWVWWAGSASDPAPISYEMLNAGVLNTLPWQLEEVQDFPESQFKLFRRVT